MKKVTALVFLFAIHYGVSAIENHSGGGRAKALSGAMVAVPGLWGAFHNQAGLNEINTIAGAVYYTSKFNLKELAQIAGVFVIPTKTGNFGLYYSQFGARQFKEMQLGLAFSKKLSRSFYTGIQLAYHSSVMPENSRAKGCAIVEGGMIYKAGQKLIAGVHVFNPLHSGYNTLQGKIKLPVRIRSGLSYSVTGYFLSCFEVEKSSGQQLVYKAGAEIYIVNDFTARFGVSGSPFSYTAGIGYAFGVISTDIAFHYHGNLGLTPAISIQVKIR